eukprot:CAMPEP_0196574002 /NCGR_PEP_ID=MMETSP1081-20130531/3801_1 /TAXON_ID=36882 /ORGANISM="Pyramimonas amylifera, Strain CCMP720" /LENGTH=234 /DNA_ID=CAMNT_0041891885 /DNA_START=471 /DNA_END=1175 /DNA_ORIENTATION=+
MTVTTIEGGKYAGAAVLGDPMTVRSTLVSVGPQTSSWKMECLHTGTGQAFVSATLGMGFVDCSGNTVDFPSNLDFPIADVASDLAHDESDERKEDAAQPDSPSVTTLVTVYADEIGPSGLLSMGAALRFFERNRTDIIGGGTRLKQIQEAGVLVVVARLTKGYFSPKRNGLMGKKLVCQSEVEFLRRNTTVVFHQFLWSEGRLVAKADVTCVCIRKEGMRICPCPEALFVRMTS